MIFVTGFPGFIGKRLVQRLLKSTDQPIVALVEPRMGDAARAAAAELAAGERVEVLPGDISERRFGISDSDWERLTRDMRVAYHLAAIYNLAVPSDIAQRVNVDGTGNVLELCIHADGLERLNYVSTAYVAGQRKGVVYEHELSLGQGFKNHYESTKFQAEVWVREEMHRVPTTIYRPAIVVGDSRTGETQKFDGPYYMLRSIALAVKRKGPIAQFGNSDAPFNVVPVDFVLDALDATSSEPEAVNQTLHLVDPEPVSAAEVMRLLSREYASKEPKLKVPAGAVATSLKSKRMRAMFGGAPYESIQYLNHAVRFDTRRADDLLARSGLRCPRFEEYVGPIVQFFREHEDEESFVPPPAE